jgi:hypothetical protein
MNLNFGDDILSFKGEINNKLGYEIKTSNLSHYGNYLSADIEKTNNFTIALSLRHILSLVKIAEMIEGNVSSNRLIEICLVYDCNGAFGLRNMRDFPLHSLS